MLLAELGDDFNNEISPSTFQGCHAVSFPFPGMTDKSCTGSASKNSSSQSLTILLSAAISRTGIKQEVELWPKLVETYSNVMSCSEDSIAIAVKKTSGNLH